MTLRPGSVGKRSGLLTASRRADADNGAIAAGNRDDSMSDWTMVLRETSPSWFDSFNATDTCLVLPSCGEMLNDSAMPASKKRKRLLFILI